MSAIDNEVQFLLNNGATQDQINRYKDNRSSVPEGAEEMYMETLEASVNAVGVEETILILENNPFN